MNARKPFRMGVALMVCALGTSAQAAVQNITFDGPGYVAGSLPPSPWGEEYNKTTGWGVASGIGEAGSQGLVVDYSDYVTYDLPTPLTPAMGAQSLSVHFDPAYGSDTDIFNFITYGGMLVGSGSQRYGSSYYNGVIFREEGKGNFAVYGPGSYPGTYLAAFSPSAAPNWYEISFQINAAWDSMIIGVGPVGGPMATQSFPWNGSNITRIWLVWGDSTFTGQPAIYDNLSITGQVPEPASMALLALGGVAMGFRRRQHR